MRRDRGVYGSLRLRTKRLRASAAIEGRRGAARTTKRHPFSRGQRQHRCSKERGSCRQGARGAAVDQLQGRRFRKTGYDAVHDRAGNLQAETRAGASGRDRSASLVEAGRSRLQTSVGAGFAPSRLAIDPGRIHVDVATTRSPICSRRSSIPRSRRSITDTPM